MISSPLDHYSESLNCFNVAAHQIFFFRNILKQEKCMCQQSVSYLIWICKCFELRATDKSYVDEQHVYNFIILVSYIKFYADFLKVFFNV